MAIAASIASVAQTDDGSQRPKLPYNMVGLGRDELDAYDSKAEPVANATAALVALNQAGWKLVQRYFPQLGTDFDSEGKQTHPEAAADSRFAVDHANEDATFSPVPLLSAIASLSSEQISGRLLALHNEALEAATASSYEDWKLDDLRRATESLTVVTKTLQGTRYRTPKPGLSFRQAVQLYSMTLVLLRKETKWTGKSDSPPPDWNDFAGRLSHQLPQQIQDGETAGFFLYRPAVVSHGLSKHEFEERADVVLLTREKNIFQTTQLPVYLTVDQKSWSPAWITAKDEASDPTLTARKFEHDWTRLDGPYLWYRADQLDGSVVYRATIRFAPDNVVIEAERQIASRGAVKRVPRPRNYDPLQMTAFDAASEVAAQAYDPLSIDPPALEEQLSGISRPRPHLSNAFRAWCKYGLDNPE